MRMTKVQTTLVQANHSQATLQEARQDQSSYNTKILSDRPVCQKGLFLLVETYMAMSHLCEKSWSCTS